MNVVTRTYPTAVVVEVSSTTSAVLIGGIPGQPSTSTDGSGTAYHMALRDLGSTDNTLRIESGGNVQTVAVNHAPATVQTKQFGGAVNMYSPLARTQADWRVYLDEAVAAGITLVRTATPWSLLQPTSATFDTAEKARVNAYLDDCNTRGLDVFVTGITNAAAWAKGAGTIAPDATIDTYVDQYLTEFGDRVIAMGHGNEPNANGPSAADIVSITEAMAIRVHSDAPGISVVIGEMAFGDWSFLTDLYTAGLTGAMFDVISCHPYNINFNVPGHSLGVWGDPRVPWPINDDYDTYTCYGVAGGLCRLYDVLTAHSHQAKPIWLTEFGFSASNDPTPGLRLTEKRMADWLAIEMRQAARWPTVEVIAPYMIDSDRSEVEGSWVGNFGAFHFPTTSGTISPRRPSRQTIEDTIDCINAGTC